MEESDSAIEIMVGEIEELMQTLAENLDERDNNISDLAFSLAHVRKHTITWKGKESEKCTPIHLFPSTLFLTM